MPFTVHVHYRDASSRTVEPHFDDLGEASLYGLRLADDLGRTATPYSRKPGDARSVTILADGEMILEITVFMGGLRPSRGQAGILKLPNDPR